MRKDRNGSRLKRNETKIEGLAASGVASGKWDDNQLAALTETISHSKKMTAVISKQDMALLLVFKIGPSVFESRMDFIDWLTSAYRHHGGKNPLKLLGSNRAKLVLDELLRIEFGIVA